MTNEVYQSANGKKVDMGALRVVAGGNLVIGNLFWAGTFLILAEVLGVVEELV